MIRIFYGITPCMTQKAVPEIRSNVETAAKYAMYKNAYYKIWAAEKELKIRVFFRLILPCAFFIIALYLRYVNDFMLIFQGI